MSIKLTMYNDIPMINVYLWSKKQNVYKNIVAVIDTGASVTTLSKDTLVMLGYDVVNAEQSRVITASGIEYVSKLNLEKVQIGNIELFDIKVHALTFPQESFTMGVIGMNILRDFDLYLLFSQNELILKNQV